MSRHYNPESPLMDPEAEKETLRYSCFTRWHFQHDISNLIESSRETAENDHIGMYALNGFYAKENDNLFYTNNLLNAWVEYKFQKVVKICKIIVRARDSTVWDDPAFKFIQIRISRASETIDTFKKTKLIQDFNGVLPNGHFLVIDLDTPVFGQYLSFQVYKIQNSQAWVLIADLKVITQCKN